MSNVHHLLAHRRSLNANAKLEDRVDCCRIRLGDFFLKDKTKSTIFPLKTFDIID